METKDERLMAALIYIISLFFVVIGPLIIWLLQRDKSNFVDYHGKEYFNFLISYTIYGVIASLLILLLIGIVLAPIVGIAYFVFTIIAAIKAYSGEKYRIPFIFRLLK